VPGNVGEEGRARNDFLGNAGRFAAQPAGVILGNHACAPAHQIHSAVGRVTPCAPRAGDPSNGAHGVTRPTGLGFMSQHAKSFVAFSPCCIGQIGDLPQFAG
jgi:hypothetical protein